MFVAKAYNILLILVQIDLQQLMFEHYAQLHLQVIAFIFDSYCLKAGRLSITFYDLLRSFHKLQKRGDVSPNLHR